MITLQQFAKRTFRIEFMVATGRAYTEAKPALEEAGIDCAMIALNGAQVFDKDGHSLFTGDRKTVTEVLTILSQHNVYYEISTNKGIFLNIKKKVKTLPLILQNPCPI